jgi:hypothetical protein
VEQLIFNAEEARVFIPRAPLLLDLTVRLIRILHVCGGGGGGRGGGRKRTANLLVSVGGGE